MRRPKGYVGRGLSWYNLDMSSTPETIEQEYVEKIETLDSSSFVMMRTGKLADLDRAFDIEYWQRQGDAAIFRAAWEMIELYYRDRGFDSNELRLQRSVENFQRKKD